MTTLTKSRKKDRKSTSNACSSPGKGKITSPQRKTGPGSHSPEQQLDPREFECSICMYILVEPVTLPCSHELCLSCFQESYAQSSALCPFCRTRIATWFRKSSKNGTLVNQSKWERIQRYFPDLVRKAREKAGCDADDVEQPVSQLISAPGELAKEFEYECKKAEEERKRQARIEELATLALIEQIRCEDMKRCNSNNTSNVGGAQRSVVGGSGTCGLGSAQDVYYLDPDTSEEIWRRRREEEDASLQLIAQLQQEEEEWLKAEHRRQVDDLTYASQIERASLPYSRTVSSGQSGEVIYAAHLERSPLPCDFTSSRAVNPVLSNNVACAVSELDRVSSLYPGTSSQAASSIQPKASAILADYTKVSSTSFFSFPKEDDTDLPYEYDEQLCKSQSDFKYLDWSLGHVSPNPKSSNATEVSVSLSKISKTDRCVPSASATTTCDMNSALKILARPTAVQKSSTKLSTVIRPVLITSSVSLNPMTSLSSSKSEMSCNSDFSLSKWDSNRSSTIASSSTLPLAGSNRTSSTFNKAHWNQAVCSTSVMSTANQVTSATWSTDNGSPATSLTLKTLRSYTPGKTSGTSNACVFQGNQVQSATLGLSSAVLTAPSNTSTCSVLTVLEPFITSTSTVSTALVRDLATITSACVVPCIACESTPLTIASVGTMPIITFVSAVTSVGTVPTVASSSTVPIITYVSTVSKVTSSSSVPSVSTVPAVTSVPILPAVTSSSTARITTCVSTVSTNTFISAVLNIASSSTMSTSAKAAGARPCTSFTSSVKNIDKQSATSSLKCFSAFNFAASRAMMINVPISSSATVEHAAATAASNMAGVSTFSNMTTVDVTTQDTAKSNAAFRDTAQMGGDVESVATGDRTIHRAIHGDRGRVVESSTVVDSALGDSAFRDCAVTGRASGYGTTGGAGGDGAVTARAGGDSITDEACDDVAIGNCAEVVTAARRAVRGESVAVSSSSPTIVAEIMTKTKIITSVADVDGSFKKQFVADEADNVAMTFMAPVKLNRTSGSSNIADASKETVFEVMSSQQHSPIRETSVKVTVSAGVCSSSIDSAAVQSLSGVIEKEDTTGTSLGHSVSRIKTVVEAIIGQIADVAVDENQHYRSLRKRGICSVPGISSASNVNSEHVINSAQTVSSAQGICSVQCISSPHCANYSPPMDMTMSILSRGSSNSSSSTSFNVVDTYLSTTDDIILSSSSATSVIDLISEEEGRGPHGKRLVRASILKEENNVIADSCPVTSNSSLTIVNAESVVKMSVDIMKAGRDVGVVDRNSTPYTDLSIRRQPTCGIKRSCYEFCDQDMDKKSVIATKRKDRSYDYPSPAHSPSPLFGRSPTPVKGDNSSCSSLSYYGLNTDTAYRPSYKGRSSAASCTVSRSRDSHDDNAGHMENQSTSIIDLTNDSIIIIDNEKVRPCKEGKYQAEKQTTNLVKAATLVDNDNKGTQESKAKQEGMKGEKCTQQRVTLKQVTQEDKSLFDFCPLSYSDHDDIDIDGGLTNSEHKSRRLSVKRKKQSRAIVTTFHEEKSLDSKEHDDSTLFTTQTSKDDIAKDDIVSMSVLHHAEITPNDQDHADFLLAQKWQKLYDKEAKRQINLVFKNDYKLRKRALHQSAEVMKLEDCSSSYDQTHTSQRCDLNCGDLQTHDELAGKRESKSLKTDYGDNSGRSSRRSTRIRIAEEEVNRTKKVCKSDESSVFRSRSSDKSQDTSVTEGKKMLASKQVVPSNRSVRSSRRSARK